MPPYRAVLFDFFGTLTRAVTRGPQHATIARSLGCDPAEMIAVLDRSFRDRARGAYGDAAATLRWVCRQAGADPSPARLRAALDARVAALFADTALRLSAVATLRSMRRRHLRTAVVSDCGYELPVMMPWLPIDPLLDARVYSVHVGACKPHPAIYLAACERLGVRPEECVYVGDGGGRELSGAARLGMTAVRLAAPDLRWHLVYDAEPNWSGPTVRAPIQTIQVVDRAPALV